MRRDQFEIKPLRRSFVFEDKNGRVTKIRTGETGGSGNKHFRKGRGGPVCGQPLRFQAGLPISWCPEPWKPVCTNADCPGNKVPRRVMRIERYGRKTSEGRPGR